MACKEESIKVKKASNRITALFEFTSTGGLKAVFLNAENEHDELILQHGLSHLLKVEKMGLIKRLFGVKHGK